MGSISRLSIGRVALACALQAVIGGTALAAMPDEIKQADQQALSELTAQMNSHTSFAPKEYLVSEYGSEGYALSILSRETSSFVDRVIALNGREQQVGALDMSPTSMTDVAGRRHLKDQIATMQELLNEVSQTLHDFYKNTRDEIAESKLDDVDKQEFLSSFDAKMPSMIAAHDKINAALLLMLQIEADLVDLAEQDKPVLGADGKMHFHSDDVLAKAKADYQQLKDARAQYLQTKAEMDGTPQPAAAASTAPAAATAHAATPAPAASTAH